MRIDHLALEHYQPLSSTAPQRGTRAVELTSSLNVLDCRSEGFAHVLSDLAGHVLYGARHPITGATEAEGYLDVSSPLGRYRFRRSGRASDGQGKAGRLTVAPLEGQPAHPDTARQLLGPVAPAIAARLMAPQWSDSSHLDWLLGPEVAAELRRLEREPVPQDANKGATRHQQLFTERDRLTHQLESMLGEKRRASLEFDTQLQSLEQQRIELAESIDSTRHSLDRTVAELAELETQRRYRELAELVERTADQVHRAERQEELAELDAEIDKWREMLAELDRRETQLRLQLSQRHPDEASPRLPIADQRAAVAVAERLLSDLDSEVARLARVDGATQCVCLHTHARLHPLVDTLGEQIDTMARLISQYEAALAAQQVRAELQHLSRAQAELRATLDHLLDRRQEGLRTSRARKASDARLDTVRHPLAHPDAHWDTLQRERDKFESQIVDDRQRLAAIDTQLEQIRDQRTRLMTDPVLARLQSELDEVNRKLQGINVLQAPAAAAAMPWRASEILAKLSDGRFREVQLSHSGRRAEVIDRQGEKHAAEDLAESDRQILVISLHLAAVAAVSRWGSPLPLLLTEPFENLTSQATSILALVLHDFARAGHQVVVFTTNTMALDRWRAAGQGVIDWNRHARLIEGQLETTRLTVIPETTKVAVARTVEAPEEPFTLLTDDAIERFPVLGPDGPATLGRLGIRTVGDLIEAEPKGVAKRLDRADVTPQVVELWQCHAALLAFVPHLDLDHAQVLTGVGVWRPEQLAASNVNQLASDIESYLASDAGARLRKKVGKLDQEVVGKWIADAVASRTRWEASRTWTTFQKRPLEIDSVDRQQSVGKSPTREGKTSREKPGLKRGNSKASKGTQASLSAHTVDAPRPLRFRLHRSSLISDAPSIGPKMAKRLQKLGIKTVARLLAADPADVSKRLGDPRVAPDAIVAWQHESQLMCRVPELLARDAQVLVGSGFTSAEEVAKAKPGELWEFVKSYCATPAGTRQLRGAAPPELARVTKWVAWAGHRRALDAA